MSLINQVLQELEKRHAADPGLTSLPPQVRAVRSGPPPAIRLLAIALILVFAAVGAFVYLSGMWPPAATTKPSVKPLPVNKQISVPAPATPTTAAPVPIEPAVQAVLLAPASRLSEELSFNPDPGAPMGRAAKPKTVARAEKPRTAKSAAASLPPDPAAVAAPVTPDPPVTAAAPDSGAVTAAQPSPAQSPSGIDKQMREMTVQQRAETAFRTGVAQLQDGRVSTAEKSFREALKEDPMHVSSRQALLGLLLDGGRNDEAEQLLRRALELNPRQPRHAMVLARLEVERGEIGGAIDTLVGALPYVRSDPEYFAFLAALLQRDGRHRDAVDYYGTALQSSPGNAVWLMGAGISLRANDQFADAREAFQRAADSKQLNAELQAFVERQLRELSAKK
ncbi:MAG TPA: tetratricopeptide repeat protein [Burkholderiales bacterium]|nr:tetratricopeptide repeat protein [Burkholderiales bacterium]